MADVLEKYLLNDDILITASDTTQLVEYAHTLHNTFPTATAALGRTLTAAAMMGSALKEPGYRLTLSLNGGGPAGTVLATANAACEVKGCIGNPQVDLPARADGKLDVGGAVGREGFLTVVKDVGLKEPYTGRTALQSGEIAEDVAYYFLQSEQQPCIVYLSVWVDIDTKVVTAGGLFISPLPGAVEASLAAVEERLSAIQNYALMLMAKTPAQAVESIFSGLPLTHLATAHPAYVCDCSRARLEQAILSLGAAEIQKIIEEDGQAELVCRFCNKKYQFDAAQLRALLKEAMH